MHSDDRAELIGEHSPTPEADIDVAPAVRRSAMDLLARREHSRLELQRKLLRRYDRAAIESAIARLADEGLQSDARFAETYVRQRGGRGYGPLRIRQELQQRGVEDDVAELALQCSDFDWREVALEALEKKFSDLANPGSPGDKARMLRFAAYRGFSRDQLPEELG